MKIFEMNKIVFLSFFLFTSLLTAQVKEDAETKKAKVNSYKFQTGELSQMKDLDLSILESYFEGNEPDDSVTIEIVYKKSPSIYKKNKTKNTYVMRTKGITKDLKQLLTEVEKFKELILEVSKE